MGFSLSWLAIKGKSPQEVRDELGFRTTGKREEVPEADLSAAELPTGWYLIVSNRSEKVVPDFSHAASFVFGLRACHLLR